MEDSAVIKPLREQFQICIKYLQNDQCANSQLSLTKHLEILGPICSDLFKFHKKSAS